MATKGGFTSSNDLILLYYDIVSSQLKVLSVAIGDGFQAGSFFSVSQLQVFNSD